MASQSEKNMRALIGRRNMVTAVLLIAAMLSAYFSAMVVLTPKRYEAAEGQVISENIYATKNVDDAATTAALRDSAAAGVAPVYIKDAAKTAALIGGAQSFFDKLTDVRAQAESFSKVGETTPEQWESLLAKEDTAGLYALTDPALNTEQLISVLCAASGELGILEDLVIPKLTTSLSAGLYEKDISKVLSACVTEISATTSISSGLKKVGESMLTRYLQATYAVDEAATAQAVAQAVAKVEPVQIKKGDLVVRAGSVITAEQMTILRQLDLVAGRESNVKISVGAAVYVLLLFGGYIAYMFLYQRETYLNLRKMTLISIQLILVIWLAALCCVWDVHMMPMLIGVMLIALLTGDRAALAAAVLLAGEAGLLASGAEKFGSDAFAMAAVIFIEGVAAIYALRKTATRGSIIAAGVGGSIAGAIALFSISFMRGDPAGSILVDAGWVALSGVISTMLVVGSLSIWENAFDLTTPARLNELLNINHPLLKQMMYEAPGTYQHCMNVAALAEGAAQKIGADPLLARVGAFYHDVGKLRRPLYFMENQHGENIHDTLPPEESASIIISHQKDSATILAKHKLPGAVVRIASEHHGSSLVSYFYHKAAANSVEEVDKRKFRYPGNNPSTKESAVVMLADCCEAGVRSLGECTKEAREAMVHKIVWSKLCGEDNLLAGSPLTFLELSEIERSFLRTFGALMHDRIEYPEEKKDD